MASGFPGAATFSRRGHRIDPHGNYDFRQNMQIHREKASVTVPLLGTNASIERCSDSLRVNLIVAYTTP